MRKFSGVALCALLAGSALLITAGPTDAASAPNSGPPGTVITVTATDCAAGTLHSDLVDVVVLDAETGALGSGTVSVTVPTDALVGHTLTVYAKCQRVSGDVDEPQTSFLVTAHSTDTVSTPGGTVTITSPDNTTLSHITSAAIPSGAPSGVSFQYGLIGFWVSGVTEGGTIQVVLTLPAAVDQYWKYQGGTWSQFAGAAFAGNTVTLTLTDGGAGDADGIVNGTIVDPAAAGTPAAAAAPAAALAAASAPAPVVITPPFTG